MNRDWIVLTVQSGVGRVWLTYRDDRGTRRAPSNARGPDLAAWPLRPVPLPLWSTFPGLESGIHVPPDFDALIQDAVGISPTPRDGPHANGPIPLPIYIQTPPGNEKAEWEEVIEHLLGALGYGPSGSFQLVFLARMRWRARTPFRLPLRVLSVVATLPNPLAQVASASWYAENPEVQTFGLDLSVVPATEMAAALRATPRDVLMADEASIAAAIRLAAALPIATERRPRLIILLSGPDDIDPATLLLPAGLALLWIPRVPWLDVPGFLASFFNGVIHDYPLHEAVKTAVRAHGFPLPRPILIADPQSDQYLRLSDSLTQLRTETHDITQTITQGNIDDFLNRLDPGLAGEVGLHLRQAARQFEPIRSAEEKIERLTFDFRRESFGMVPMAEAEAALDRAKTARHEITRALRPLTADENQRAQIQAQQERRVDISMDQRDSDAVYRPHSPQDSLVVNGAYNLLVTIGHPQKNSLVVGEIPPLDPLLPEPDGSRGHALEIVVFEKDFALISPRVQSLYLPLLGGSDVVSFAVRAPQRPGKALLRMSLYYRNYLLQSFLLQGEVREKSVSTTERQVLIRLDFSRTARFTNLEDLQPRLLSIGVNDNQGGTHSFLVKKDKTAAQEITFTEAQLHKQIQRFREILSDATADADKQPRFLTNPSAGTAPSAYFPVVLRELAELGRDLYRLLYPKASAAMKLELESVAKGRDQTIQVTRHDPNFVFPWPVVYDYPLPVKVTGAVPAPICMGHPLVASDFAAPPRSGERGCPHNPDREVYCIEGFWGVRHRLEQLIDQRGDLKDAVDTVSRSQAPGGVRLATSNRDQAAQDLVANLQRDLLNAFAEITPEEDFWDLLWHPAQRPSVLIVLGHLQTAPVEGEPEGPRILLLPREHWHNIGPIPPEKWLLADSITDHEIDYGRWQDQPLPLVLLMACEAAATDIDTLNDFVKSLTSAGAAAVVGTECIAFTALVARFAREITLDIWNGVSLGQAIQAFNRRLISASNPLGFVFSCFGSADLHLAKEGTV